MTFKACDTLAGYRDSSDRNLAHACLPTKGRVCLYCRCPAASTAHRPLQSPGWDWAGQMWAGSAPGSQAHPHSCAKTCLAWLDFVGRDYKKMWLYLERMAACRGRGGKRSPKHHFRPEGSTAGTCIERQNSGGELAAQQLNGQLCSPGNCQPSFSI